MTRNQTIRHTESIDFDLEKTNTFSPSSRRTFKSKKNWKYFVMFIYLLFIVLLVGHTIYSSLQYSFIKSTIISEIAMLKSSSYNNNTDRNYLIMDKYYDGLILKSARHLKTYPSMLYSEEEYSSYNIVTTGCEKKNISKEAIDNVLFAILSKSTNFLRRQSIRDTWGVNQNVLFFYSYLMENETIRDQLNNESAKYQDMIPLNFVDTYYNLTLKVRTVFEWVNQICLEIDRNFLLVKGDDDVFVNVNTFEKAKSYFNINNEHIYGHVFVDKEPKRTADSKYYVSIEEYPYRKYPNFISGSFYVLSPKVMRKLLIKCNNLYFFKLEDVFFTGICAEQFKIYRHHVPSVYSSNDNLIISKKNLSTILSVHRMSVQQMYKLNDII
ncbi:beta-1,3-galactosyltransferase 5-like [Chelonus insularis]|uniref:beta-1,3-galactosyltransferase 5-like n=1 Tax=Chelonus insularis TaxID=460826 RepID=UPI00158E0A96|nr:beta-1,3-galactosyltransferase 5-like [Chelonus insularis]